MLEPITPVPGARPSPTHHCTCASTGSTAGSCLGYDVRPADTLAYVLRDKLGFSGLKMSCDAGACGACTVLMDGRAVLSCMVLRRGRPGMRC